MREWSKSPSNNRAGSGGRYSPVNAGGGCRETCFFAASQIIMRFCPARHPVKDESVVRVVFRGVDGAVETDSSWVGARGGVGSLSKQVL